MITKPHGMHTDKLSVISIEFRCELMVGYHHFHLPAILFLDHCWTPAIFLYSYHVSNSHIPEVSLLLFSWEKPWAVTTSWDKVPYLSDSYNHSVIKWSLILFTSYDCPSFTISLCHICHLAKSFSTSRWGQNHPV